MDRFSDLEQKWIGKQKKKRILFAIFALVVVFGYLVYVQFFDDLTQVPAPKQVAEVVEPKQIEQVKSIPEDDKKPLSLAINKSFEEDIQNKKLETQKPAKKEPELKKETQIVEKKQKETKVESKPKDEIKKEPVEEPRKEAKIQKVETKVEEKAEPKKEQNKEMAVQKEEISRPNLEILYIEEFLADKRYEKALKIAKFYFENNKHEKAIKWSLEANKINSADEESWIIFAKSSVVLGRSDQAKRALSTYLQKRDSVKIKKLLNEVR